MVDSDTMERLCIDMANASMLTGDTCLKDVSEELAKERGKDPDKEYVSLKTAIKIYLEASSNYGNELFARMCEIQDKSERRYDEMAKRFMMDDGGLSDAEAEKMIRKLKIHHGLYSEIIEYILAGNIYKKKSVNVEGYSAQKLCSAYGLSAAEAYAFLMYLREDRKNALAELEAGLMKGVEQDDKGRILRICGKK